MKDNGPSRILFSAGCAVVLLLTIASFCPVLSAKFINWDDDLQVTDNPLVRSLSGGNIRKMFSGTLEGTYIPLTLLTHAIEYRSFGFEPFVYHLTNLVLHLGVVLLVWVFARQCGLGVAAAGLGTLVFALHPLHVESVAWVTERKDVLYAFFYMLALILYGVYVRSGNRGAFAGSVLCGFLSVLSKSMAVSLPFVLLVCDWFWRRPITRRVFLEKIPFGLALAPVAWITFSLHTGLFRAEAPLSALLAWVWTFMFYVSKFVFPWELVPMYVLPQPVAFSNPAYPLSLAAFGMLVSALLVFRRSRWFLFSVFFYTASIFFLLRVDLDPAAGVNLVADRFMYLPALGFCLLLGRGVELVLEDFQKQRKAAVTVVLLIGTLLVAALAVQTNLQCRIWSDSLTFWNYTIAHTPQRARPIDNAFCGRAFVHGKAGRYDLALADLNTAIAINPDRAKYYNNRGIIYDIRHEYNIALLDFSRALLLEPDFAEVYFNRARVYSKFGRPKEALRDLALAIALKPEWVEAYERRAIMNYGIRNYGQALADFDRAIALNPERAAAYFNRGVTRQALGVPELALADFLKAQSLGYKVEPALLEGLQKQNP